MKSLLAASLLLCACTHPSADASRAQTHDPVVSNPAPPAEPSASPEARTPVVVRWENAEMKDGRLSLVAVIERRVSLNQPLTVVVVPPAGVSLLEGQKNFTVAADQPAGVDRLPYVFSYGAVPSEDLELVADLQTESWGVHATDRYRFGRAEPQVPHVEPNGPEVKVGGVNLGRAHLMPSPKKE